VNAYPTPEIMRAKADRLESHRNDGAARNMVTLMRAAADDMESGDLWEDERQLGEVAGVAELTSNEMQRLTANNDGLQFALCSLTDAGDGNEVATMMVAVSAPNPLFLEDKGRVIGFTILTGEPTAAIVGEALRRMPGGGDG
jgi:hypothetical protein